MKAIQLDQLNLVLIVVSLALAFWLPFELFLMAYAILGPLHYLTETNWIRDKAYFMAFPYWKHFVITTALLFSFPYIFKIDLFSGLLTQNWKEQWFPVIGKASVISIFLLLVMAVSAAFGQSIKKQGIIGGSLGLLIVIIGCNSEWFSLIFGLLLTTIIHVYLFTILFMCYGTKKASNYIGVLNLALMVLVPFILYLAPIEGVVYEFTTRVKEAYMLNNFHVLNAHLAQLIGAYDSLMFFFYENVDIKIQIFIAFAYCYHYLNWFSKTTIIGWHKKLNSRKSLAILVIWGICLGVYAYDYRLGVITTIFLSVLHVLFELPLNALTIKSLLRQ